MRLISILFVLLAACVCDAGDRKGRNRSAEAWSTPTAAKAAPTPTEQPAKPTTATTAECTDALAEVNAERAKRGLAPFTNDPLLAQAAYSAASYRAKHGIHGHVEGGNGDFQFLPTGANSSTAGCGALEDSWGWGTCCTYDNFSHAGAAWVRGADGRRYMHLFVRNESPAVFKAEVKSSPPVESPVIQSAGSCASGSCGASTRERRGLFSRR